MRRSSAYVLKNTKKLTVQNITKYIKSSVYTKYNGFFKITLHNIM